MVNVLRIAACGLVVGKKCAARIGTEKPKTAKSNISPNWPIEAAVEAFGPGAHLTFGSNSRVSAAKARAMLGWKPSGPTLMDEIERGTYLQQYGKAQSR